MPTTRAHAARLRMQQASADEGSPPDRADQEHSQERRRRLHRILALFDPAEGLPDDLEQQIHDRLAGVTENVSDIRPRYYASLCKVVIEAGENDDVFYSRINTVAPESFCAIDSIRKNIDSAFRNHNDSWQADADNNSSDELEASLRTHVQQIGRTTSMPRIDKVAAIYAVATLLRIIEGIIDYHTSRHPSCDIHQSLLDTIFNELDAFPEDVWPANLDAVLSLVGQIDEHESNVEDSTSLQQLARRLHHLVRYLE